MLLALSRVSSFTSRRKTCWLRIYHEPPYIPKLHPASLLRGKKSSWQCQDLTCCCCSPALLLRGLHTGVCHPRGSCAQDRALPVGDADAQRAPRGGQLQHVPVGRAGSAWAVKEVTPCLHRNLKGENNKYSTFHTSSGACCPSQQHRSLFPHFSCLSPSCSTWFRNYRS